MIFKTLCYTALRASELCNLKVKDIDLKSGVLRVLGKGSKLMEIPLSPEFIKELSKYITGKKANEYIFLSEMNNPVNPDSLRVIVSRYKKQFQEQYPKVEKVHPHVFRHTAITRMLGAEIPIEVVKEIARHSKIETTMIYTHIRPERLKKEIKKYKL